METENKKLPSRYQLVESIKNYFEKNQKKKDIEKELKLEREVFEEHVMTHCDGHLRIGNFEVLISPLTRNSFDLDYAEKALSKDDFDRYIKPFLTKSLSTKLNVKKYQ